MSRYFIILMAVVSVGSTGLSYAAEREYQHSLTSGAITFQWTLEPQSLHIRLSAKTTGWVGIGFNPSKGMKDANFIIGYVKEGNAFVRDQFGDGENSHAEDVKLGGKDDIADIAGKESDGVTEISFTIPLNAGDKYDGLLDASQEGTVLLAYAAGMDSFLTRHKYRTRLKVNLTSGSYKEIK